MHRIAGAAIPMILVSMNLVIQAQSMKVDNTFAARVWANRTIWQKHVEWLLNEQMSCSGADPKNDQSPCNRFVGRALERVYGINDFTVSGDYLDANAISTYLLTHTPPWRELGRAGDQTVLQTAQQYANEGRPVLAVRPDTPHGHVALVLPGKLKQSSTWTMSVPNSASFTLDAPTNEKHTYVGGPLSRAFSNSKKEDVKIYVRF